MTVEEAIYNIVSTDVTLIATVPVTGIYLGNVPQTTANPCVIITRSGSNPDYDKEDGKTMNLNFEVDIFADTYPEASEIADLVRGALDLYVGDFTGFEINRARFDGEDYRDFDPDNNSHQVSQGYIVRVKYD